MADEQALCQSLEAHGESLAVGLGIAVAGYLSSSTPEFIAGEVTALAPGQTPDDLPPRGLLLTHRCQSTGSGRLAGSMGWFFPEAFAEAVIEAAGTKEKGTAKLTPLAQEIGDHLASDRYTLTDHQGAFTDDAWGDYLAGDLPPAIAWQQYTLAGVSAEPITVYLAWPMTVLEAMFGTAPLIADPAPTTPALSPSPSAAIKKLSPRVQRLLKTQVPVIVSLASKQENAGKILQIAIGSIIEFDRSCDEPLQFSINNLPIGFGEAVKIGDHFGLRIVSIVTPEERLERLGGKWQF